MSNPMSDFTYFILGDFEYKVTYDGMSIWNRYIGSTSWCKTPFNYSGYNEVWNEAFMKAIRKHKLGKYYG